MSTRHPLEYPEIKKLFLELFPVLISESDRGAVLVGASIVDDYLTRLFEGVASAKLSNKRRKSLLEYPGPLSTFSAKVEVAYATRLIERRLYDAINAFRSIRNAVAHRPNSFTLRSQADQVRNIYRIGDGMPIAINQIALDFMLHQVVNRSLKTQLPGKEGPAFGTPQEVIEFLSESKEVVETLDSQLPRHELAIAVLLICALLLARRDEAKRVLGIGEDIIVSRLTSRSGLIKKADASHEDKEPKKRNK